MNTSQKPFAPTGAPMPAHTDAVTGSSPSRRALRGVGFAEGEAALAPDPKDASGAVVQRKVSDIKELGKLKTPKADGEMETSVIDVAGNTQSPEAPLPWTPTGWDAQTILTRLGQHDQMKETDSDGRRCVQAVALASHVLSGPGATGAFLGTMVAQGMKAGPPSARSAAAMSVLNEVRALITAKKATFGDLGWAQEALHDMSYGDNVGTPEAAVASAVVPDQDGAKMEKMSQWCANADEVLALGAKLEDKQQYLICTWSIGFNANFGPEDAGEDEIDVGEKNAKGETEVTTIKRIDASKKPPGSAYDPKRDSKSGHQMLLYKTAGKLWLYDPELTKSGQHLAEVAKDGAALKTSFRDLPKFSTYAYVEMLGKVTPPAA